MFDGRNSSLSQQSKVFYGYYIVVIAFLVMLLAYGVRTSFGVFFKPMLSDFEWTRAFTSGAVTVSMIIQGLWGIFMGGINDRIGSRLVITVCCFFLGVGLLLTSMTQYSWQLYLFYGVIIGLGMGGVFVALMSTVTRWFVKNRGLMCGIVLAGIGAGTVIMAPLSNWLISVYGWRTSNIIIGAAVLVLGITAAQFLKRDPAGMGMRPYSQGETKRPGYSSDAEGISLKGAVKTSQFWMLGIVFACIGYSLFTVTIHLVPHITDLGISAAVGASALGIAGAMQSVGGIAFGIMADRIGNRSVILIGMVLASATLFWLVSITSVVMFFMFAIIYSLGIGGATAMQSTIAAELFGMKAHGLILGIISFGFTIGGAAGPLVTGYLFDIKGNYQLAFLICAGTGVLGLVMTLLIRPMGKRQARRETLEIEKAA